MQRFPSDQPFRQPILPAERGGFEEAAIFGTDVLTISQRPIEFRG